MKLIDADKMISDLQAMRKTCNAITIGGIVEYLQNAPTVKSHSNLPLTLDELRKIVDQLESCDYECIAGSLSMNADFVRLKELAYPL